MRPQLNLEDRFCILLDVTITGTLALNGCSWDGFRDTQEKTGLPNCKPRQPVAPPPSLAFISSILPPVSSSLCFHALCCLVLTVIFSLRLGNLGFSLLPRDKDEEEGEGCFISLRCQALHERRSMLLTAPSKACRAAKK